jgi:5-methylcytosine-specific restriction endonuclease McrA
MAMKAGVPGALRRRVFREGGYICAERGLTGREERFAGGGYGYPTGVSGVFLSIDHIVPRSKGGSSERSNLRILCTTCNTRKGTGLVDANRLACQRGLFAVDARAKSKVAA